MPTTVNILLLIVRLFLARRVGRLHLWRTLELDVFELAGASAFALVPRGAPSTFAALDAKPSIGV
jgi:hypothetical protein